jgi:hypothetical protein
MTELRRRMMEDLALAGYSPKTQKSYLDSVRALAKYYMRSPDQRENKGKSCAIDITCIVLEKCQMSKSDPNYPAGITFFPGTCWYIGIPFKGRSSQGRPAEKYLHSTILDVLFLQISRLESIGPSPGHNGNGDS